MNETTPASTDHPNPCYPELLPLRPLILVHCLQNHQWTGRPEHPTSCTHSPPPPQLWAHWNLGAPYCSGTNEQGRARASGQCALVFPLSNLLFSVKSPPNFTFKRIQRSLKLGGSSNYSNSSSISSNIPSSLLTLPPYKTLTQRSICKSISRNFNKSSKAFRPL